MSSPLSFHVLLRFLGASALLFAAGCTTPVTDPQAPHPSKADATANATLKSLDYSGSQQSLETLDRAIAAAGKDTAKVSALVADLVDVLKQPDISAAARQAVCERIGQLLVAPADGSSALSVLAPLLRDERHVNVARLAMEPVPGGAVDALFLRALSETSGSTRLALVASVGNRRIAAAVPVLAALLKDSGPTSAGPVAAALGQIGTSAALSALLRAPDPVARVVVDARLVCAWRLPGTEGNAALRGVFDDSRVFVAQRAAAFRGLLEREPATAGQRIVEVLAGADWVFKRVAIEAILAHPAPGLAAALGAKLAAWDAPTQAAVVTALGRKGDAAAVPAVVAALAHTDADVRAAAIGALGSLPGNPEIATRLARVAAETTGDEAKLARRSLDRLNGPGVTETILKGAEQAAPALRAVFLEESGMRNMTEAMPLLLKTRGDADADVRSAALGALAVIAPASEQGAILAWTIAATDDREVTRALRALVNVLLRSRDSAIRARAIIDAIDHGTPVVQLRLLPVLARLADAATLACAGRLALRPEAAVATAATTALARWPDDSALPLLVATSAKSTLAPVRAAAVQGAMRFLEQGRGLPSAEKSALVAQLIGTTQDVQVRKNLVFLLARGASAAALKSAEELQRDPALADVAREAASAIRANQAWPPIVKGSENPQWLNNLVDGKTKTIWKAPATAGQWIQVDFKQTRPVRRITLEQTNHAGDYPERYEVFVTDDPAAPGKARATGTGGRNKTVIELPPGTRGRIVIIKNTATRAEGTWAIAELQVD